MPSLRRHTRTRDRKSYWSYRYKTPGRPQRELGLGYLNPADAAQIKAKLDVLHYAGHDPAAYLRRTATPVSDRGPTLTLYAELEDAHLAGRVQSRTAEMTAYALHVLREDVGDIPLDDLSPGMLRGHLARLREARARPRPWSATTLNIHLRALRASLQRAVDVHRTLTSNPADPIRPYTVAAPDRPPTLTPAQVETLLDAIPDADPFHILIRFYLLTGCRRNEALDLTWADIDLPGRRLWLGRAGSRTKRRRRFPITGPLADLLTGLRPDLRPLALDFSQGPDRVFPEWTSGFQVSRRLQLLALRVDALPDRLSCHWLRHTVASEWAMAGVPPQTVADLLGNSVRVVHQYYTHLRDDHRAAAASRLPWAK